MRRALSVFVLAATLAVAITSLGAHTFPVERSAVLQIHTAHAELLLVYVEPPGPRTERLLALYDQNHNGRIDGLEERIARRAFLGRAFDGLSIDFDAKSAEKTAEIRYKRDSDGGLSVAIYQRFDLVVERNSLTVSVNIGGGETVLPLQLIVEPADKWTISGDDAKERKLTLSPGNGVDVRLSRTPTRSSEPAQDYSPNLPAP